MKRWMLLLVCVLLPGCATASLGNYSDAPYQMRLGGVVKPVYLISILDEKKEGGLFLLPEIPSSEDGKGLAEILKKAPLWETIYRGKATGKAGAGAAREGAGDLKGYLGPALEIEAERQGVARVGGAAGATFWLVSTSPSIVLAVSRDHENEPRETGMEREVGMCLAGVRLIPDKPAMQGMAVERLLVAPMRVGIRPVLTVVPVAPGTTLGDVLMSKRLPDGGM